MSSKKINFLITIFSLIILAVIVAEFSKQNITPGWKKFQQRYKRSLLKNAKNSTEKSSASSYKIELKQIVMDGGKKTDRCITCHVAMEDPRMKDSPYPLQAHSGTFLADHPVEKIGCTSCHDGQGKAVTYADAMVWTEGKYWEEPALKGDFAFSKCATCHKGEKIPKTQLTALERGRKLFDKNGCMGCHKVGEKGGNIGPELTDIGRASFYLKAPSHKNREELLKRFDYNVNIAYLYESVKQPHAQPLNSKMPDMHFSDKEALDLAVYLKSFISESVDDKLQAKKVYNITRTPLEEGKHLYSKYCTACHGENGVGSNLKEFKKIAPNIGNPDFLSIVPDNMLKEIISNSKSSGSLMPAFKKNVGLSDREIDKIVLYVKSLKSKPPTLKTVESVKGYAKFGEKFFKGNCSSCHGELGRPNKGSIAPSLNNNVLSSLIGDDFFIDTVVKGRKNTAMPAWHGLNKTVLADLLAFFKTFKKAPLNKKAVLRYVSEDGNKRIGKRLYKGNCKKCHGKKGIGGVGPNLSNEDFQRVTSPGLLYDILVNGRQDTAMPSWTKFSKEDLGDIITYIKSLNRKVKLKKITNNRVYGSERDGKVLYKSNCAQCHGTKGGDASIGPKILSSAFLKQMPDEFIKEMIVNGRTGTRMRAFVKKKAGISDMTDREINSVVAYIRSHEDKAVKLRGIPSAQGNIQLGKKLFKKNCSQCHGQNGEGVTGPAIGRKDFLDSVSDGFITATVLMGRDGTGMRPFSKYSSGSLVSLSDSEVGNVIKFLRSNISNAEKSVRNVTGNIALGKNLFARDCAQCHGNEGRGGFAPELTTKNFLKVATPSYLQATMALGRDGTKMRPVIKGKGGLVDLSNKEANDIIKYLMSFRNKKHKQGGVK